jgi:hypothetical protein
MFLTGQINKYGPRIQQDVRFRQLLNFLEKYKYLCLFMCILAIGVFARTWQFFTLPPGLHQDEASIGVDAFYLYKYGIDRNGFSYPVHLVSWGSGQNVLYAYLLIPFIASLGLKAYVIRIPILLSGIFTLPLIYFIGKWTVDRKFGLLAMFCIAISPWHILLSRWGLESNLLPFFFALGYLFLLKAIDDWRWFLPASFFFGICLYVYGTAYLVVPIFLALTAAVFLRAHILNFRRLVIGLLLLFTVGWPILLFVLVNLLKLQTLYLGPISIPRLPTISRFEGLGAMFQGNILPALQNYALALFNLLMFQDDFRSRNVFPPYGYFYTVTFPFALVGAGLLFGNMERKKVPTLLLFSWLFVGIVLGVLEPVIINRINIIFIPLILCVAYCVYWFGQRYRIVLPLTVCALLIAFCFFTKDYHGADYRQEIGREFYDGLIPAIDFARQSNGGPICITTYKVYMPYIFVLYTEQMSPFAFMNQVKYIDESAPLREVRSLGRYTFGLDSCKAVADTSFILFYKEKLPYKGDYHRESFGNYVVYSPK